MTFSNNRKLQHGKFQSVDPQDNLKDAITKLDIDPIGPFRYDGNTGNRVTIVPRSDKGSEKPKGQPQTKPKTPAGYVCTTQEYNVDASFNKNYLLGVTNSEIYPGNIISSKAFSNGSVTPVNGHRQPYDISVNITGRQNPIATTVPKATISASRQSIRAILPYGATTPANAKFESTIVTDEKDLRVFLKAGYDNGIQNISGSAEFNRKEKSHTVVVKFIQLYYTVDFDKPPVLNSSTIFADQTQITDDMLLVSQVGYGRQLIFAVDTSYSSNHVEAALEGVNRVPAQKIEAKLEGEYKRVLESSRISVYSSGGSASDGLKVISGGLEEIKDYLESGANFGQDSPASPLFYSFRFLKSYDQANVRFTTSITKRVCRRTSNKFDFFFDRLEVETVDDWGIWRGQYYGIGWCNLFVKTKSGERKREHPQDFTYLDRYGRMFEILPQHAVTVSRGKDVALNSPKLRFDINAEQYGYDSFDELMESDNAFLEITFEVKERDPRSQDDIFPKVTHRLWLREIFMKPEGGPNDEGPKLEASLGRARVNVSYCITPIPE